MAEVVKGLQKLISKGTEALKVLVGQNSSSSVVFILFLGVFFFGTSYCHIRAASGLQRECVNQDINILRGGEKWALVQNCQVKSVFLYFDILLGFTLYNMG